MPSLMIKYCASCNHANTPKAMACMKCGKNRWRK